MPFAGPEMGLGARRSWWPRQNLIAELESSPGAFPSGSTNFQQLTRRLNNLQILEANAPGASDENRALTAETVPLGSRANLPKQVDGAGARVRDDPEAASFSRHPRGNGDEATPCALVGSNNSPRVCSSRAFLIHQWIEIFTPIRKAEVLSPGQIRQACQPEGTHVNNDGMRVLSALSSGA